MPAFVDAIEKESWIIKPVGPLGTYLRVADLQYCGVLESVLETSLNTFVVQDLDDRTLLRRLRDDFGLQ